MFAFAFGDIQLSDGRRVLLFSSDAHLKILARAGQILQDATFRITPSLWTQTFIINASVTSSTFIPTVIALLPDKKRDTYDAMFGSLKENLEARGLELSARYMMSLTQLREQQKKMNEDLAHSLTQLRKQHEEDIKTKDHSITQLRKKNEDQAHSITQLRKLYEEEKKKTVDHSLTQKMNEAQAHSLTQFRKLYEEEMKTKDHSITQLRKQYEEEKKKNEDQAHSLTQLREQYEEEKYKTEEVRKICERVEKKEKQEVREWVVRGFMICLYFIFNYFLKYIVKEKFSFCRIGL